LGAYLPTSIPDISRQSSHPDIKLARNSLKIKTWQLLNRHTSAAFAFSTRWPPNFLLRLIPFWPGRLSLGEGGPAAPELSGEGGYPSHAGGRGLSNPMKTIPHNFSSRHTHARVRASRGARCILGGPGVIPPVPGIRRIQYRLRCLICAKSAVCRLRCEVGSEQKTKGEVKANRNTRPLKNR